jgi:hypothetical protein
MVNPVQSNSQLDELEKIAALMAKEQAATAEQDAAEMKNNAIGAFSGAGISAGDFPSAQGFGK